MYHIKKDGTPGLCRAKERPCPLGGDDAHYSSFAEAAAAAHKQHMEEFGLTAKVEENNTTITNHEYKVINDRINQIEAELKHIEEDAKELENMTEAKPRVEIMTRLDELEKREALLIMESEELYEQLSKKSPHTVMDFGKFDVEYGGLQDINGTPTEVLKLSNGCAVHFQFSGQAFHTNAKDVAPLFKNEGIMRAVYYKGGIEINDRLIDVEPDDETLPGSARVVVVDPNGKEISTVAEIITGEFEDYFD